MTQPFIGEIRAFPYNFTPRGWAACDGQTMLISGNTALFSLIGTYYGGDGRTNFKLPDLQGKVPMSAGNGLGLSSRDLGQTGGSTTVTLTERQMGGHTHTVQASGADAVNPFPTDQLFANEKGGINSYTDSAGGFNTTLAAETVSFTGGGQPHNNMAPYLAFRFCIALEGVYPSRQ